jgi:uncharacterized membrane protein
VGAANGHRDEIDNQAEVTAAVIANGGKDRPVALSEDVFAAAAGIAVAYATSLI